ncbi:hypothetical protein Hanom_Chr01g00041401 [Helianthus anomalus]
MGLRIEESKTHKWVERLKGSIEKLGLKNANKLKISSKIMRCWINIVVGDLKIDEIIDFEG